MPFAAPFFLSDTALPRHRQVRTHYGSMVSLSMPDLRWSPAAADANTVLAEQIRAHYDGTVVLGRLCFRCGSATHGRPWARAGVHDVPVSVSRSSAYLVTAVAELGTCVGVDVEELVPDADWPLEQMLAPGESADDAGAAARLWVTKEAILKAEGVGLTTPMTEIAVVEFDGTIWECEAPPGYIAAAALLGQVSSR